MFVKALARTSLKVNENYLLSPQDNLNPKKLRIMEVAENFFSTHGYEQTSIRTIANAANTNSCMINYYFGSKEKLILEIIAFRTTTFRDLISSYSLASKNPMQILVLLAEIYLKTVFSQIPFYMLVLQLFANRNERILSRGLYDLKLQNLHFVTEQVEKGVSLGIFSEHTSADDLLRAINSTASQFLLDVSFYRWYEDFKGAD